MSRHLYPIAVSMLLFVAAGVGGVALAQPGRPGAPAPHPAMPAPHIAAPAPHIAAPAPHFAAPHMAAPAPHFAAPAPRVAAAPHFAAPPRSFAAHAAAPHMAHSAPHASFARIERGHGAPPPGQTASEASRRIGATHEATRHAPTPSPEASKPALANSSKPSPVENRTERQSPATAGQTVGSTAHQTVGQSAATHVRPGQARTPPILQNPVFANQRIAAASRMTPSQWTFRGHFAQAGWGHDWRHHHHAGIVLGFIGPVFWPYAYDDFVDYTFAPYAYDTFWPYAFDDVYAGIYGGYAPEYYGPEDAYAYAGSAASERSYARTAATNATSAPAAGGSDRICSSQAAGVTDFSIQRIAQQVNPDEKQQALLDHLKTASIESVNILQAA